VISSLCVTSGEPFFLRLPLLLLQGSALSCRAIHDVTRHDNAKLEPAIPLAFYIFFYAACPFLGRLCDFYREIALLPSVHREETMRSSKEIRLFWVVVLGLLLIGVASAQPPDRRIEVRQTASPAAKRRIALVIGNSRYDNSELSLPNPEHDAHDMGVELQQLGFEVFSVANLTKQQIEEHFRLFGQSLPNAQVALFYYAGHGTQVDGENYVIPIDATVANEAEIKQKAVHLRQLLQLLQQPGQRTNFVILDACRNNPFRSLKRRTRELSPTTAPTRSDPRSPSASQVAANAAPVGGLAKIDISLLRNTLIAYSTQTDSVASDGMGRNGLYTQELLAALRTPGLPVETVFKRVREQVIKKSGGVQTPWENSSLIGEDFYFLPPASSSVAAATAPVAMPSPVTGQRWEVVADRIVPVPLNQLWTETPIQIQAGQHVRLKVDATQLNLGALGIAGLSGLGTTDAGKPAPGCATGVIVARIGAQIICVEAGRTFTATSSGTLWLGINERNVSDNRGAVNVKVVVQELRP
jgi:uncharacterized caspase-like protein